MTTDLDIICLNKFSLYLIFGFQLIKVLFDLLILFPLGIDLLLSLIGYLCFLVIQADQIFASNVEAIQMIYCIFGIIDVFIDNECSVSCLWDVPSAYLTDGSVLAKDVVKLLGGDFLW